VDGGGGRGSEGGDTGRARQDDEGGQPGQDDRPEGGAVGRLRFGEDGGCSAEDESQNAQNFWELKKKDDAIAFSKDTIAKLEAFEKAISASTVDPAAATAAQKEYAGTCRNCHMKYRDRDANGNYIIKPGTIDGQ
jgi:hypothetical protein